jgi:hypothetical protein
LVGAGTSVMAAKAFMWTTISYHDR